MEMVNEIGCQGTSMSFAEFSANLGYKTTSEGKQIMKSTEKNCLWYTENDFSRMQEAAR